MENISYKFMVNMLNIWCCQGTVKTLIIYYKCLMNVHK